MKTQETARDRFGRILRVGGWLLLVLALAVSVNDTGIGWLIPLTVIGGGLVALVLIALGPGRRSTLHTPDAFGANTSADVLSVSRVRVAGLGGLGLVAVAFMIGLEYPLATAVLVIGLGGGTIGAVAVILYRRRAGRSVSGDAASRSVLKIDGASSSPAAPLDRSRPGPHVERAILPSTV